MSAPKHLLTLVFTLFCLALFGQMDKPVKWYFKAQALEDGTYEVVATARILEGWYIYSNSAPEDSGLQPTDVNFTSPIDLVGSVSEAGTKIDSYQPETNIKVVKLANKARYTQRVRVKSSLDTLEGVVSFMTCTDNRCLPPQEIPFSVTLQ